MKKLMFFRYDPEEGIDFFETEKEAKDSAIASLEACRDISSSDGWPEETEEIVYGKVIGSVKEVSRITREQWNKDHNPEDDPFPCPDFDEMVDYDIASEDEEASK